MKDYYKILEIQELFLKEKVRYNKYAKVMVQTHDEKLKELISDRLSLRNEFTANTLKIYCEDQIELQIPTWQKAAKKAGWRAP
jgi:hypothetical protein